MPWVPLFPGVLVTRLMSRCHGKWSPQTRASGWVATLAISARRVCARRQGRGMPAATSVGSGAAGCRCVEAGVGWAACWMPYECSILSRTEHTRVRQCMVMCAFAHRSIVSRHGALRFFTSVLHLRVASPGCNRSQQAAHVIVRVGSGIIRQRRKEVAAWKQACKRRLRVAHRRAHVRLQPCARTQRHVGREAALRRAGVDVGREHGPSEVRLPCRSAVAVIQRCC